MSDDYLAKPKEEIIDKKTRRKFVNVSVLQGKQSEIKSRYDSVSI